MYSDKVQYLLTLILFQSNLHLLFYPLIVSEEVFNDNDNENENYSRSERMWDEG